MSGNILNKLGSRYYGQHLRSTTDAERGHVLLDAVLQQQVVAHVACGVVVALGLYAVPWLWVTKKRRTYILATRQHHGIYALHHISGIGARCGATLYSLGVR